MTINNKLYIRYLMQLFYNGDVCGKGCFSVENILFIAK